MFHFHPSLFFLFFRENENRKWRVFNFGSFLFLKIILLLLFPPSPPPSSFLNCHLSLFNLISFSSDWFVPVHLPLPSLAPPPAPPTEAGGGGDRRILDLIHFILSLSLFPPPPFFPHLPPLSLQFNKKETDQVAYIRGKLRKLITCNVYRTDYYN